MTSAMRRIASAGLLALLLGATVSSLGTPDGTLRLHREGDPPSDKMLPLRDGVGPRVVGHVRVDLDEVSPPSPCPPGYSTVCWACRAASSEEQCLMRGHYQVCNEPQATCEHLTRVDEAGDVTEVKRGCRSKTQCVQEGLGCRTYGPGLTYCRDCTPLKRSLEYKCLATENICKPHTLGVGSCTTSNDPYFHYVTFDGQRIPGNGSCKYQLSAPCPGSTLPYFAVHNSMARSPGGATVGYVEVELETNVVRLMRQGRVLLNGDEVALPVSNLVGGFRVVQYASKFIAVITDLGLVVLYDGQGRIILRLPDSFKGSTCGMCGDYNGDMSDDLRRKDGLDISRIGQDAFAAVVQSWQVDDPEAGRQCHIADCGCDYGLCMPETGKCRCPPQRGGSRCQYKISSRCMVIEDTHVRTYDGAMLHVSGTCKYLLTGTCPAYNGSWPPPFRLHMRTEHASPNDNSVVPRHLELHVGGHVIRLYRDQKVMVDGEWRHLPVHELAGLDVFMYAGHVMRMRTSFGLSIYLHKSGMIKIKLPAHYEGHLCGLCGNYNWLYWDDVTTSEGEYVGGPEYAASASSIIASSWISKDTDDPRCSQPSRDPEPLNMMMDVEGDESAQTLRYCSLLTNMTLSDSPFSLCLQRLGNLTQLYYQTCRGVIGSAVKVSEGEAVMKRRACRIYEALASDCSEIANQPMTHLRAQLACPLACPSDMVASAHAPAYAPSCGDNGVTSVVNVEGATEGCVCGAGYVLDHDRCVAPAKCGCHDQDGVYRTVSESWLSHDCSVNYTCSPGGSITSSLAGCGTGQVCKARSGVRQCIHDCSCQNGGSCLPEQKICRCPWGFAGKYCQETLSCCRSWGDLKEQGFPSTKFIKATQCNHLLSGVCRKGGLLPAYNVSRVTTIQPGADNSKRHYESWLGVMFESHEIVLRDGGQIEVDGHSQSTPVRVGTGLLLRTASGTHLVSDYLTVRTQRHMTEVCVPASHSRHLCGLCGEFSMEHIDRYVMGTDEEGAEETVAAGASQAPGTGKADRVVNWTGAWQAEGVHGRCETRKQHNSLPTSPPTPEQLELIDSPEVCGSIKPWEDSQSRIGPFSACLQALGDRVTAVYYKSCVREMTSQEVSGMSAHDIVCDVIQAFAAACEEENVTVRWRQYTKCYAVCPPGQVYYDEMSSCPASCVNPTAPLSCPFPSTDGCGCPDGFLLSRDQCVPVSQCGCVDPRGQYHQLGSNWLSDDCIQRYTCLPSQTGYLATISQSPGCNLSNETCVLVDGSYACQPAMVDGGWGAWSLWSSCDPAPLSPQQRVRMRTRQCNDPLPSVGGEPCLGSAVDVDMTTCHPSY